MAKQIKVTPGAPVRNGDVLVPGYDVEGKLWTVQYIKEDGMKRFAKDSRKHGCFHVVGAPNGAAVQNLALSPVVVISEGYATAATIAKSSPHLVHQFWEPNSHRRPVASRPRNRTHRAG
jgi:putative DNA primase/helicase